MANIYDIKAEESILGAVLSSAVEYYELVEVIPNEDYFSQKIHRVIYKSMTTVFNRGDIVESSAVMLDAKKNKVLDERGWAAIIIKLSDMYMLKAMFYQQCRLVTELYKRRKGVELCLEAVEEYKEGIEDADSVTATLIHSMEKKQETGNSLSHISETLLDVTNALDTMKANPKDITGVNTGISDLNRITRGWQPTDLIILAARPGQGKTALSLTEALNAASSGSPVQFFSLEMSKVQLTQRMLASVSTVHLEKIRNGEVNEEEQKKILNASTLISKMPIYIDDRSGLNISQIAARAKKAKMQKGIKLIIVDYLQLIQAAIKTKNRNEQISEITGGLKNLAKSLDVPIIALSQLSRDIESRKGTDKRPKLSDLRDGGSIEQDADMVMFIHHERDTATNKWHNMILIEKYRHGKAPQESRVKFASTIQRWVNYGDDAYKEYEGFGLSASDSTEDLPF